MNQKVKSLILLVIVIFSPLLLLGLLGVVYVVVLTISNWNSYVSGDINHIQYAPPTQEAIDFNWEGYVTSLPEVQYEKVNYPVKGTYTSRFNGYTMTIDVPEDMSAETSPFTKSFVLDSKTVADSCVCGGDYCDGPCRDHWSGATVNSADSHFLYKLGADGIRYFELQMVPKKSQYKAISLRDIYVKKMQELQDRHLYRLQSTNPDYSIMVDEDQHEAHILLSDQQGLFLHWRDDFEKYENWTSRDLFFSILHSIRITKDN